MKDTLRFMYAFALSLAIMLCGFQGANADPIEISDWHDLNDVRNDLQAEYVLVNDLDEETNGYSDYNDDGWESIGDADDRFMGSLDGQGYAIHGLTIDADETTSRAGLFGQTHSASIKDLSILDADITTSIGNVGVLAGRVELTEVGNVTASGTIMATGHTTNLGGLVGRQIAGLIYNSASYVDLNVEGRMVGGISGTMTSQAETEQSYYKGDITTDSPSNLNRWIGGITGQFGGGSMITNSYAIADVKGTHIVGGIVGWHWRGGATVTNSYSVGEVEGDQEWIDAYNDTTDADNQIEDIAVGGVIGHKDPPQEPESADDISGLVNTFWDTEVSGHENIYGTGEYHEDADIAEGKTTDEMKNADTFAQWNLDAVWAMDENTNEGYPHLLQDDETVSAEDELTTDFASEIELKQNYPNPFNPSTNIEFTIPNNVEVQLDVYNVAGQRVATLVEEHMSAGTHTVTFEASELPSGVYIYRLTAGNHVESNKMSFIK